MGQFVADVAPCAARGSRAMAFAARKAPMRGRKRAREEEDEEEEEDTLEKVRARRVATG